MTPKKKSNKVNLSALACLELTREEFQEKTFDHSSHKKR